MTRAELYYGYDSGGMKTMFFKNYDEALTFFKTNGVKISQIKKRPTKTEFMWFEKNDYSAVPVQIPH